MTIDECMAFVKVVDEKIGNPKMKWDGPEPHDFRDMTIRGVRFVHSELYLKTPDFVPSEEEAVSDYAPDGKLCFRILAGDDAAAADIGARITAAGWAYLDEPWHGTPNGHTLSFTVDTRSPLP
jgi:hypothetical protein